MKLRKNFLYIISLIFCLSLILFPQTVKAENSDFLVVKDENGYWGDDLLFDECIYPGSEGSYSFTVTNTADVDITYHLEANGAGDLSDSPFSFYLEVNNDTTELTPDELAEYDVNLSAGDTDTVTISWYWAYYVDDDHDEYDTYVGILANSGVDFDIDISIVAEYDEEDEEDEDSDDSESNNTSDAENDSSDDSGVDSSDDDSEDKTEKDHKTGDSFPFYLFVICFFGLIGLIYGGCVNEKYK